MTDIAIDQQIEIFSECYSASDFIYPHSCLWGDFNFCLNGVFEYEIAGEHHLSPPSYGLWIPPHTEHSSAAIDDQPIHYVAIRLAPNSAAVFPLTPKCSASVRFLKRWSPKRWNSSASKLLQRITATCCR